MYFILKNTRSNGKKGHELIFISFIKRDGSGTVKCGTEWNESMDYPKVDDMSYLDNETFTINCLSLSKQTFIASGFNSFVVRLKSTKHLDELKKLLHKELFKYGFLPLLIVMERMAILGEFEICNVILQTIKDHNKKYNLDLPTKLDGSAVAEMKIYFMTEFNLSGDIAYNNSQEYANNIQESIKIETFFKKNYE